MLYCRQSGGICYHIDRDQYKGYVADNLEAFVTKLIGTNGSSDCDYMIKCWPTIGPSSLFCFGRCFDQELFECMIRSAFSYHLVWEFLQ